MADGTKSTGARIPGSGRLHRENGAGRVQRSQETDTGAEVGTSAGAGAGAGSGVPATGVPPAAPPGGQQQKPPQRQRKKPQKQDSSFLKTLNECLRSVHKGHDDAAQPGDNASPGGGGGAASPPLRTEAALERADKRSRGFARFVPSVARTLKLAQLSDPVVYPESP